MLLTITTTYSPASDLSYLLHKHPGKLQSVDIAVGKAHLFYPEVSDAKCTIALLMDLDPIGLVRRNGGPAGNEFALEQYVNDRPYVASSFMSAAIVKAFSTAMSGRCKDKPELVTVAMPFEVHLPVLPVRGGENMLRQLFEPLGYRVECTRLAIDPVFPEWGESRYFDVRLFGQHTVQQMLSHLYILIPVCDNDKHYWIGQDEVEKLLEKGKDWLPGHPMRELIAMRYLKHQKSLAGRAMEILLQDDGIADEEGDDDGPGEDAEAENETKADSGVGVPGGKIRVHDMRLRAVRDVLLACDARTVVDLGCGEGKLLRLLLAERQFEKILGMDVSYRGLAIAKDKLKLERLPSRQQQRIELIQGALTYRDKRIAGFDAAAMVEVIEHLDESRLAALERVVFEAARPGTVVVTTPNVEYNRKFPDFEEGKLRHSDHRFEWTRAEFKEWGDRIAERFGYAVTYRPVGEEDPQAGALTQMAIFTQK